MNKKVILPVVLMMLISLNGNQLVFPASLETKETLPIRFHVLANSDEPSDQSLKRLVRDDVMDLLQGKLAGVEDRDQAWLILAGSLDIIEDTARRTIAREGYNYSAKAQLGLFPFPTKSYGDVILPAGEYYALRVVIGKGEGENWWCVIFPELCLVEPVKELTEPVNAVHGVRRQSIQIKWKFFQIPFRESPPPEPDFQTLENTSPPKKTFESLKIGTSSLIHPGRERGKTGGLFSFLKYFW